MLIIIIIILCSDRAMFRPYRGYERVDNNKNHHKLQHQQMKEHEAWRKRRTRKTIRFHNDKYNNNNNNNNNLSVSW